MYSGVLVAAAIAWGVAGQAGASSAEQAFLAGNYAAARTAARAEETATGYSLACQAGLIIGSYFDQAEARVETLHSALDDCANSIRKGGGVDAHVNYAIAVAFEAKRVHSPGLAADSRKLIEESIKLFPDSGFAHGALGGWHASVSAQGFLARKALGASREAARAAFVDALRLDPDNVAMNYEYLRFLARGDAGERAEAAKIAGKMAGFRSSSAFLKLLQERAAKIAGVLPGEGRDAGRAREAVLTATEPFNGFAGEGGRARVTLPFTESFVDAAGAPAGR